MFDFNYTDDLDNFYSSFIDSIVYNANTNEVAIDVAGTVYLYKVNSGADVQSLVTADSVGAYYNKTFKHAFGPGRDVGRRERVKYHEVNYVTAANYQATPEFSLVTPKVSETSVFDHSVSGSPIATTEFSLSTPPRPVLSVVDNDDLFNDKIRTVVHFRFDDNDKEFNYAAKAVDVSDALDEAHEYLSALSLVATVTKVVTHFE